MKQLFTQFIFIYLLFWCFGCSSKRAFYLPQETGSFRNMEKVKPEQPPKQKTFVSASETDRLTQTSAADNSALVASSFLASRFPEMQAAASLTQAGILPAGLENSKILQIPTWQAGKLPQKISRKQNSSNKKFLAIAVDGKPTHKLAKTGFLLSLGGILTILISVLLSSAAPLLLGAILIIAGLITSIKGLAKIKQAPDEYGGKGFAITGILLSGLILLISIAFILYVLSFAGAFV